MILVLRNTLGFMIESFFAFMRVLSGRRQNESAIKIDDTGKIDDIPGCVPLLVGGRFTWLVTVSRP